MATTTKTDQQTMTDGATAARVGGLDHLAELLATIAGAADYLGIDSVIDEYLDELSRRGVRVAMDVLRHDPKDD